MPKLLIGFIVMATSLQAAISITFQEIAGDVVSTFSGTLNTDDPDIYDFSQIVSGGLFAPESGAYVSFASSWRTPTGSYVIDNSSSNSPFYEGPREGSGRGYGTGTQATPTSVTGDAFGMYQNSLILPGDWTSGSSVSGTMTWENTTLSALGYDSTQDHVWTLRGTSDTITMTVVPEPSSIALLTSLGVLALAISRRRKSISA